jgi:hypothetical protein
MTKVKVNKSEIPEKSILKEDEGVYDYVDSFQSEFIDEGQNIGVVEIGKTFFTSGPKWAGILFIIRDKIVGLFGLKTSGNIADKQKSIDRFNWEPGKRLGLFKIFNKTNNEIILGENDKHLDFRISLFLDQKLNDVDQITISTIVKYNNWFGKLYFLPVRPFHKLIVPSMLKGIIRELER